MKLDFIVKLKQTKLRDMIYPAITVAGLIIFLAVFALSVRFLFVSINSIFGAGIDEGIIRFDADGFSRISDILNINVQ